MNSERTGSGGSSAATSPKSPPTGKFSEADYLARQVADAKAALSRSLREIGTSLGASLNLKARVYHHPLISLGTAAALGFAASALTPVSAPAQVAAAAGPFLRRARRYASQYAVPLARRAVSAAIAAAAGSASSSGDQQRQPGPAEPT